MLGVGISLWSHTHTEGSIPRGHPRSTQGMCSSRSWEQQPWMGKFPALPEGWGGNGAALAAAGHAHPVHCTTIGFAAALPFTAWKLNCKMSKTFPNCAILAWFY